LVVTNIYNFTILKFQRIKESIIGVRSPLYLVLGLSTRRRREEEEEEEEEEVEVEE